MTLKQQLENRMIDGLTPRQVRYLHPVPPAAASGRVAAVYRQVRQDFQIVPPLTLLSQQPELLAALWAIVRESQIVCERVPRARKEALSAAVSQSNACPYCVDAHLGMMAAADAGAAARAIFAGDSAAIADPQTRRLVDWGLATRDPDSAVLRSPPFTPEEAPEVLGTTLAFQFVNRMAGVFLGPSPMPVPMTAGWSRRLGIRMFGVMAQDMLRKSPRPGASLDGLPAAELPDELAWARPAPHIASAFASFCKVLEELAEKVPAAVREALTVRLEAWRGEPLPLHALSPSEPAAGVQQQHQAAARLALLTALAPERVDARLIEAFRREQPTDTELLATTAWAAYAAARRINRWLRPPA
jgi:AhpD family alkylhydroperoxidase